ncbi:MAG: hypothetical protein ACOYO1_00815 [Bacteroidales bacterium]
MNKKYIEINGTFEIMFPKSFKFQGKSGKIYIFKDYRPWLPDSFQLSILNYDNDDYLNGVMKMANAWKIIKIGNIEYYTFNEQSSGYKTIAYIKLFDKKILTFTFTYLINPNEFLDNRKLEDKLETVYEIINSFKFVDSDISIDDNGSCSSEKFNQIGLADFNFLRSDNLEIIEDFDIEKIPELQAFFYSLKGNDDVKIEYDDIKVGYDDFGFIYNSDDYGDLSEDDFEERKFQMYFEYLEN